MPTSWPTNAVGQGGMLIWSPSVAGGSRTSEIEEAVARGVRRSPMYCVVIVKFARVFSITKSSE
ncbi:hypothetical protein GGTG_12531 [Gaeumannomyces tritici R3-111a-1]|uniref:Uncharacterized protein n=1 Tax=Gaeumannomyces tritici (strain R3-111a-1) TaxID=644352 RepID=J3PGA6_GAET3|nr:hypothetical protein GGTG_12531 [Gaeumannomyces tritici R3-111a-1]EJT69647.1 hypothetical protein GGTG_12531 [Gaeumannomyces tritici R3-111a-1]